TCSTPPLPPGPFELPLIGHLHHLLGLPHRKLKDLSKIYGPIMYLKLGEVSTVVISSPGVAEQIMKTHDLKFVDRPQNLVSNVVQSFWSVREEETCKDKKAFMPVAENIISLAAGFSIADLYPSMKFLETISGIKSKIKIIHQKVDKILNDIIREHKENRMETFEGEVEEDLVDVLLRIQERPNVLEFPITIDNVKAVILDMFIAGTDTSSTLMEWTFIELLRSPRVMEKAQEEVRRIFNGEKKIDQADIDKLNYLRLAIKESLRLHPPAPLLVPRECRERCELEGYEIPKGSKVVVNAWAMGRDPENWKDPESFEPERFQDLSIDYRGTNFKYIPFGAGRRMCPGILFGIANVELPLALLLYHFDWKFANGVKPEELDMTEEFSISLRRKQNLHVIPTRYSPS
ncbi:hypothetical protein AQUCO_00500272v1, partial [Aquilegia coerulea]